MRASCSASIFGRAARNPAKCCGYVQSHPTSGGYSTTASTTGGGGAALLRQPVAWTRSLSVEVKRSMGLLFRRRGRRRPGSGDAPPAPTVYSRTDDFEDGREVSATSFPVAGTFRREKSGSGRFFLCRCNLPTLL